MSQELIDKMDQLRKLFQVIATPELLEAMRDLKQALQNIDDEQLKASMEAFEFEQEEFLKRLERSLSILKRIRTEQQLMAAVRQAQDLAARQDELRYATENTSDGREGMDLADKQEATGRGNGFAATRSRASGQRNGSVPGHARRARSGRIKGNGTPGNDGFHGTDRVAAQTGQDAAGDGRPD